MHSTRYDHTVTLLPNGNMLITGGSDGLTAPTASAFAQAVTRFRRFAVADTVGQDNEELLRGERLGLAEKFAGKFRPNELPAAAGRSVHDENDAAFVVVDLAERAVMNLQLRPGLVGSEFEIANDVISFVRARDPRWRRQSRPAQARFAQKCRAIMAECG